MSMKSLSLSARPILYLALIGCSNTERFADVDQPLCINDGENMCPCPGSPIVIDVAGDGIQLTSWRDGVRFGLRPGTTGIVSWTAADSDDAWLVMDRDGNGIIDDASEMFGNFTLQPELQAGEQRNGFRALAVLDANRDSTVDNLDPGFAQLRLWQDTDHDGISRPEELIALSVLGVDGLSVEYSRSPIVDEHGNRFAFRAPVYPASGRAVGMTAWDVWLTGTRPVPSASSVAFGPTPESDLCGGGPAPKPDLEPSFVVLPPEAVGHTYCFGFSWQTRNLGMGSASAHHWAVYLNGQLREHGSSGSLAPSADAVRGAVLCPPYEPLFNFVQIYVNTPNPPPPAPPVGNGSLVETSYANNFVSAPFVAN